MELVFEPDLKNGTEAAALIRELILILKRIETCSCDMEEGTLRVDANISVNKPGHPFGTRTEVKNINSLRYIARAIDFEINRQIEILESGGKVINETRAYDYSAKCTKFMRDKEMLQDYRFMPEPNLPPIEILEDSDQNNCTSSLLSLGSIKKQLPMVPETERNHLVQAYQVPVEIADKLVHSSGLSEVFEAIARTVDDFPVISNYLLTSVQSQLNARSLTFEQCEAAVSHLAELVKLLATKKVSEITADKILELFFNGDKRTASEIVESNNWYIISDEKEVEALCAEVLVANPKVVKKYVKKGKKYDLNLLLRDVLLKSNNRVSVKDTTEVLKKLIARQRTTS
ncbi:hypothetical protein JTE90_014206 [Oedothorax gibbosus]|uniref:Asn/Gln amidotransferase domain-containing protein n=1 Tax=Oedothorax gibbosus TaxID=931172 RepID=A0AAV6U3H9_9ARAC|nr:hypothetical protein JTE90_014206 [Oedothorax gibbosus]